MGKPKGAADDGLGLERTLRDMSEKYDEIYARKVVSALAAEEEIANTSLSGHLQYASIVLFKATQNWKHNTINANEKSVGLNHDYKGANNVDSVANAVEVISLDCHHYNILDACGSVISDHLMAMSLPQSSDEEKRSINAIK